jgi:hypothetical protein
VHLDSDHAPVLTYRVEEVAITIETNATYSALTCFDVEERIVFLSNITSCHHTRVDRIRTTEEAEETRELRPPPPGEGILS